MAPGRLWAGSSWRLVAACLLALAALGAGGCSLVVEGTEPPACGTNEDCAVLNELEGIEPGACVLYQCGAQSDRCELGVRDGDRDGLIAPECASEPMADGRDVDCNDRFAGGMEVCNGVDDDCDGIIDEAYVADEEPVHPLPAEEPAELFLVSAGGESVRVGYGAGEAGLSWALTNGAAGASFGLLGGASAVGPEPLTHARAQDLASLSDTALVEGCHVPDGAGGYSQASCSFTDVDLGLTEENVFAAAVHTSGCREGQLRVGYVERARASAAQLVQRGPARRSNVFAGVDVDPSATGSRPCTGASRTSGAPLGAARPSVAAMETSGDQALAAWLAAPVDRPECGGEPVDVEILSLHVQQVTVGTDTFGWVTASNEGAPQVVGTTTGGGRPGVGAWENTGYLVAFGTRDGISLSFVAVPPAPPAFTDGAPDDRTGLETPALAIADLGTLPTSGPADDVALSFGSIRMDGIDAAVAWREGCGTEAQSVWFRQIFLRRDADDVSLDLARSFEPVQLTAAPIVGSGPPSLAYTFDGLLAPGVDPPGDRPAATDGNAGGWVVAWTDGSAPDPGPADDRRVVAARVSEMDGAPLVEGERLVLHPPADVRRVRPVLYRAADHRIRYAFLAPTGGTPALRGGALTCVPAR